MIASLILSSSQSFELDDVYDEVCVPGRAARDFSTRWCLKSCVVVFSACKEGRNTGRAKRGPRKKRKGEQAESRRVSFGRGEARFGL